MKRAPISREWESRAGSAAITLCMLLMGCGGTSDDPPTEVTETPEAAPPGGPPPVDTPPDIPPAGNTPPEISGIPSTALTQGNFYEFQPLATDADGDSLTFSISNPPVWATFDDLTGSLTGMPTAMDIGTTLDVTITVFDGTASASLPSFDLQVLAISPGSAEIFWDAPMLNADDTPLNDLAGFRVRFGTSSGDHPSMVEVADPDATSVVIDDLTPATYFFVVTAYDFSDNESLPSAEVSKVILP